MTFQKRVLGKTGIKVTRMGFGGIPIQRLPEKNAVEVVQRSYELGINFFDTARAYTKSEKIIGKALKTVRDEVIIATKSVHRDKKGLLKDLETSLEKLQTEWIDIYQLHMISKDYEWEKVMSSGGAVEGLLEAKDTGKINHIGITSHNPELMMDVIQESHFETIMIPYNYLTQKPANELIPQCKKLKVGTIVMKPLGGGAITNIRTALKYVLRNHEVDVVIPGMMSIEEIKENLAVSSGDYSLTEEEHKLIEKDRTELGNQFCRACDYCQPCPQDIPISFVLRVENQFLNLTGWTPRLINQIPKAKTKVSSCVRCGQCEERCPYELPIMDLLPLKMRSLVKLLNHNKS
jgi:predicted aldo/keto reductase-like oxidoreductase